MSKIRCAVIGVGYLGRFHAQKYQLIPEADLIAVCDVNYDAAKSVAQELNVPAYQAYSDLFGKVDAVSIAATTNKHYEIAKACIEQGIHVLIEKPITETVSQAEELIDLAKKHKVKIQVGHLERFNSARMAIEPHLTTPHFIETERLAPFTPRCTDVNVILDLMIHDIDMIQNIVNSPIKFIDAHGTPVLTKEIDIANAHILFENQCVANITASRISFKTERKARIFQNDSYISLDFQNKQFALFKKGDGEMYPGIPDIQREQQDFKQGDALLEQIRAYVACIQKDTHPLVTGKEGRDALATAQRITTLIHENLDKRHVQS